MFKVKVRMVALALGLVCVPAVYMAFAQDSAQSPGSGQNGRRDLADIQLNWDKSQSVDVQDPATLPSWTNEITVTLAPGTDPRAFASRHGLKLVRPFAGVPDHYVFAAVDVARAKSTLAGLSSDTSVKESNPNMRSAYKPMGFTPNDPYFPINTPSAGYAGQWHLKNMGVGAGQDANLTGAWSKNWTGNGVVLGVVDDCCQIAHPDLNPNVSFGDCYDFGQNDTDPSPVYASDMHGTSVSGVAAARGGNGIGVTGAAPRASLAGLRIDFPLQTTAMFQNATLFNSSGGNTNIKVKNHSYGYSAPSIATPGEVSALETSAAAGTIHCLAAGNNRGGSAQDSNVLDIQNTPDTICVAALADNGTFSYYSNFGACVAVTAPSNGGTFGITTTDRTGADGYNGFPDQDYTDDFGGTSSATPLTAGVMALVKQVNPNADGRFAKHILSLGSDIVDPGDATVSSDGGWHLNGGGRWFNQNYGWGKLNAGKLTQLASFYSGCSPMTTNSWYGNSLGTIPDNDPNGLTYSYYSSATDPMEEVVVHLNVTHTYRGDLELRITSPSGTVSRFMMKSGDSGDNIDWDYVSNAFWGENPNGYWSISLSDRAAADTGTWDGVTITNRMGHLLYNDKATNVDQYVPNPMVCGQTYKIKVVLNNNGGTTWYNPDYQLQSLNPPDNLTWDYNRIDLKPTNPTLPGHNKTWSFTVHAPLTPGVYPMKWGMINNLQGPFGAGSPNVNVTVNLLSHAARFVTMSTPTTVHVNQSFNVDMRYRNVGTMTWTAGAGFHLKSTDPDFNTTWGVNNVNLAPGDSIAQTQSKLFSFTCTAPSTPGDYVWSWRMYRDGRGFFGDRNTTRVIHVIP